MTRAITKQQAQGKVSVHLVERYDECAGIRAAWDSIVRQQSRTILQLDVTSTFDWTMALWDNHLHKTDQKILLLERDGAIMGIVPLYRSKRDIHYLRCREIEPISELYAGRGGFIFRDPSVEYLDVVIDFLYRDMRDWDTFQFSLLDGSASDAVFQRWKDKGEYRCDKVSTVSSPYMELTGTWRDYFDSLPKKFREQLRRHEKKLCTSGTAVYKAYRSRAELEEFLYAVLEIERQSWKEDSRTSITQNRQQETFYRRFAEIAGTNGWFSGHLLLLNEEPIAYIYGILYNKVFCSLKTSHKARYRELSSGHLIRRFAVEQLYSEGATLHDFTGLCEEHKMRWTSKTYSCSTYLIYNNTARGLAAYAGTRIAQGVRGGVQMLRAGERYKTTIVSKHAPVLAEKNE